MLSARALRWLGIGVIGATIGMSCSRGDDAKSPDRATPRSTIPQVVDPDVSSIPKLPVTSTAPPPESAPSTTRDPATMIGQLTGESFQWTISEISTATRARMDGRSMRPGCPVSFDELRYLTASYWDFEGVPRIGELVVHRTVAEDVITTLRSLFDSRFPIRKMVLVDDYGPAPDPLDGASDFISIEDDNTSAFNCRRRSGSQTQYSQHSYGLAIDINPIENPYVSRDRTAHPASRPFLDRSNAGPGVILEGGPVVAAFDRIGWGWGGRWSEPKDFQHFSSTGN